MTKDQLSWDQLFALKEATPAELSSPDVPAMTEPPAVRATLDSTTDPAADSSREAAPKKSSIKKTQKRSSSESEYAKKNWGKLAFESSSVGAPPTSLVPNVDVVVKAHVEKVVENSLEPEVLFAKLSANLAERTLEKAPQVYSISEINRGIRETLESKFSVLWLKGEISNFKAHTSGHFYFSLKDSKAQISAVMFRGFNTGLRFRPEDGMEVLVRGKVTVYEPRGNYQIFCETMEPVGAGALQKAFEQLKSKLQQEGLFDESRKRALPTLPRHIAIVTSPTGAAVRDMLNVLGRRFRGARITVIPCKVQGDQAPFEIVRAIELANRLMDVDVMIVGRGGGSIEDLWAFNEEKVARAIAAARVPVISAVGHEIDFTIADFVADLRAPTPSAAAELVVKNASDLVLHINGLDRALRMIMMRLLNQSQQQVVVLSRRLVDPQRRILEAVQRCDELVLRLAGAVQRGLKTREMRISLLINQLGTPSAQLKFWSQTTKSLYQKLSALVDNRLRVEREHVSRNMALLDSLSPLRVLDRGFSMVTHGDKIVTKASELEAGDRISIRLGKGAITALVEAVSTKTASSD